jgi:K+/H+ antiporter YhaU regulatory subunit KhtT
VKFVKLNRGEQSYRKDALEKKLKEGDVIVLHGDEQRIIDLDTNEKDGIKLLLDFNESRRKLPGGGGHIIKVLVRSVFLFDQRSLAQICFWERFGAVVVGVHRAHETYGGGDTPYQSGSNRAPKASQIQ